MTNAHVVSRSPSSIEIAFKGRDFVDAYKVYFDPNPDLATFAIDNLVSHRFLNPTLRDGSQRVHIVYDTFIMCGLATSGAPSPAFRLDSPSV